MEENVLNCQISLITIQGSNMDFKYIIKRSYLLTIFEILWLKYYFIVNINLITFKFHLTYETSGKKN